MQNNLLDKLLSIGFDIKNGKHNSKQGFEILNIIEEIIFNDDDIAFSLHQKNLEIFDFEFKKNAKSLSDNELFFILQNIQKVTSIYFINNINEFAYFFYQEVNEMIKYSINQINSSKTYNDINKKYSIQDHQYHEQIMLFKYQYSILDKFINILEFLLVKFSKTKESTKDSILLKDFSSLNKNIFNSKNFELLEKSFKKLSTNNSYHYLRKLRNSFEHNLVNPNYKKNYLLEVYMMQIIIFYIYFLIINSLKTNEEIYSFLN